MRLSDGQYRCHMVVAVRHAVQATAVRPDSGRSPAWSAPAIEFARFATRTPDRREGVDAGPPIDLIVTLGRLLV